MNRNYIRGRAKEYRLKKKYEELGYIVLRTAGSHGFADLVAIDMTMKHIRFIQVKPKNFGIKQAKKLYEKFGKLFNQNYFTYFVIE